jgi:hypothetical protein
MLRARLEPMKISKEPEQGNNDGNQSEVDIALFAEVT